MPAAPASLLPVNQPSATARERLIVALDFPDADTAMDLVQALGATVQWYKVGLELYLGSGHGFVSDLVDKGYSVFLDLKLHDIPNTVAGAVRSAARCGASLLTIHAAGGPAMIAAAADAANALAAPPSLLAVTVLTSMDQQQLAATGISSSPAEQVLRLAHMAVASGANGVVCSPEELSRLRIDLGTGPILVAPGIRPADSTPGDQKRIATPSEAIRGGADFLVVGRPITKAHDPRKAVESILAEMQFAI